MIPLRQSTAATAPMGPFTDVNGDVVTTLTINQADVRLSKNGGAYAQKADITASAHMEGGRYAVALNATDTGTAGRLRIDINVAGALPVWVECAVLPQAQFDALYATGAGMPAQVTGMDANVLTAAALAADAVTKIAAAIVTGGPINAAFIDASIVSRASSTQAATIITDIGALNDPTAAAVADAVWDELLSGHVVAGSAGEALARVDVVVSTRATETNVNAVGVAVVGVQNDTDDIQARLPAALVAGRIDASVGAIDAAATAAIVDRLLGRSIAGGADGGRTVTSALRKVRNRVGIVSGIGTVYQEDDTTPDHTAPVLTAPGNPIIEWDPDT